MNILESIFHDMAKPPAPAHMGESFLLWTFYLGAGEARTLLLVLCNHTNDSPLKEWLEHYIADVLEPQIDQVKKNLTDEGIPLPGVTPDPPKADQGQIPSGARLCDELIAKMCMVKILGLLDISYQGLRFSFRSDIGATWHKFQQQHMVVGYTLRELMLQRGWITYPPVPLHSSQQ